ncbi:MAG: SH3 domain-containing protein [Dehalococcoidia bacterium]
MPQFNWSILAPIVLAVAAIAAGIAYIFSVTAGHSHPASQRAAALVTASPPGFSTQPLLVTPARGVQLPGRVTGTPHLRSEPDSTAPILTDLHNGDPVQVSACSLACGWYLVAPSGRPSPGWVSAAFIMLQGDEHRLPVVK